MSSSSRPLPTQFAPAERLSPEEIQRQVAEMHSTERLRGLLDSIPNLTLVLNAERQILLGNEACQTFARTLNVPSPVGLRLGELLSCHRAARAKYGCGTTDGCRTCGAIRAVLGAASGRRTTQECRISDVTGTAYDLRITASRLSWENRNYLLVVLDDISAEKRRQALERIFFHDVLNTAGSINGLAMLIADEPAESYNLKDDLLFSAESLVNEIRAQRMLLAAEDNQLVFQPVGIRAGECLRAVQRLFRLQAGHVGRNVVVEDAAAEFTIETDQAILQRVLVNMVKNALEATHDGETIRIGVDATPGEIVLWCHNPGVISAEDALQVFQRGFSTKGPGRGLGTYSMKLLGERYLGGRVTFTSTQDGGTRFQISLPRQPSSSAAR